MRRLIAMVCLVSAACNRGDGEPLRRADGSLLASSGGEVALADGSRLQFVVTSQRYKQWETARAGLRKNVIARFGTLLRIKSPTETSIQRATEFLETDVTSKEAIERAGMSVRDFVLMTVALDQEMRLASGRGREAPPLAAPSAVATPVDTTIVAPGPDTARRLVADTAAPASSDTARDTLRVAPPDSTPRS